MQGWGETRNLVQEVTIFFNLSLAAAKFALVRKDNAATNNKTYMIVRTFFSPQIKNAHFFFNSYRFVSSGVYLIGFVGKLNNLISDFANNFAQIFSLFVSAGASCREKEFE